MLDRQYMKMYVFEGYSDAESILILYNAVWMMMTSMMMRMHFRCDAADDDDATCAVWWKEIQLPSKWHSTETGEFYERREIKESNPEYQAVINNMARLGGDMYAARVYKVRLKIAADSLLYIRTLRILIRSNNRP